MAKKTRSRRILAHVLVLGLLVAFYSPHPLADACSIAGPPTVTGLLGVDGASAPPDLVLPSNAASIADVGGEAFMTGGVALTRVPSESAFIDVAGGTLAISDAPDLTAPDVTGLVAAMAIEVSACGGCAYGGVDASRLQLNLDMTDDTAAFEQLSVAVFLGDTEESATLASRLEPDFWVLPDASGELWTFLPADDPARFAVVRVFDQAGNASAPTPPTPISR